MFGKEKNQKQNKDVAKPNSNNPMSINSLVEGTTLEGHLTSKSDIRIDGKLKGTLDCAGKVIIGPNGFIEGDVECKFAVVEGRFEGSLEVEDTLQVRENAVINGDINTNKLVVQAGAVFNVTCKMGGQILGEYSPKRKENGDSRSAQKPQAEARN